MTPEQVPELLVDEFRACADTAELLSRAETREGLALVLGRWEEARGVGCLWETIGKEHGAHDRGVNLVAAALAGIRPERYTLVLQRCAVCLSLRVQSLPGHWTDTQLGVTGRAGEVPPPRSP